MSAFWSGVIATLIGGVIGGAFAALAAWIQVRGALRAALIQVEASFKNEQRLQAQERQHGAALELLHVLSDVGDLADEVMELHRHKPKEDGWCPEPDASPSNADHLLRRWRRTEAIYAALLADDLWDRRACRSEISEILEDIVDLTEADIWSDYKGEEDHCVYFTAAFVLEDRVGSCRKDVAAL